MLISLFDKTIPPCKIVKKVLVEIYFKDKMETLN